jgi:hypothetical protein
VKLFTRLDNEAIDVAKGRSEMPAAVARLAQLVRPARLDLVDEVLARVRATSERMSRSAAKSDVSRTGREAESRG